MTPRYVKFGLAGYGPDLTEEDFAYTDVTSLCQAICWDLNDAIEMLADEWGTARDEGDAEAYMAARELADALDTLRMNLDYGRRMGAPLYAEDRDQLDADMLRLVDNHFPLNVSTNGYQRLYVWEAEED